MARLFASASSQSGSATITIAYPFTVACWYYMTDLATTYDLAGYGNSSANAYMGYIQVNGAAATLRGITGDGVNTGTATSTGTVLATTWQHGCYTAANNSTRTIYLNGSNSNTDNTATTATGNVCTVGAANVNGSLIGFDNGRVAEVGYWSVVLGADDITALAAGCPPLFVRPDVLVAYYPLWGTDSPEPDWNPSGTVTNLTLTNAPTQADHAPVFPVSIFNPMNWAGTFPLQTFPPAYRRFYSPLGTREGTRQLQGWT